MPQWLLIDLTMFGYISLGSGEFGDLGNLGIWGKEISGRGGRRVSAPFVSQMWDGPTILPTHLCLYSLVTRLGLPVGWALRMPDLTTFNWLVPDWTPVDSSYAACWWPPLASIQVQIPLSLNQLSPGIYEINIQLLIWMLYSNDHTISTRCSESCHHIPQETS